MRERGSWLATACSRRLPQNLKLVSFAVNSQATASIGPARLGTRPRGATSGRPRRPACHDSFRHLPEIR